MVLLTGWYALALRAHVTMSKKRIWGVLLLALCFCLPVHAQDRVTLQLKWHHQFQFACYYAAKALVGEV